MIRIAYLLLLGLLLFSPSAHAQSPMKLCFEIPNITLGVSQNNCINAPVNVKTNNNSVSITTGGTFQTVVAASATKFSVTIQNNNPLSGTEYCYVHVDASSPTIANSIVLGPGGSYQRYFPFLPSEAIQVTCTTNNDTVYVDTQ